jgi:hypothetical protein
MVWPCNTQHIDSHTEREREREREKKERWKEKRDGGDRE